MQDSLPCRHDQIVRSGIGQARDGMLDIPPLQTEGDIACVDCGATLTQLLADGGIRPFAFHATARESLRALVAEISDVLVPALELQIRAYQYDTAPLGLKRLNLYLTIGPAGVARELAARKRMLQRLARALAAFVRAIRAIGEPAVWMIYNEARGFPSFDWDADDEWAEWIRDLYDMQEVAAAETRTKRQRGPRAERWKVVLEHRIARAVAEAGVGKASTAAQRVFAVAVKAATGTTYRDLKRALARAHKSLLIVDRSTPADAERLRLSKERAKVRGFR